MSIEILKEYWNVHVMGNLKEYKSIERILSDHDEGFSNIENCKRLCLNCVTSLHHFRDYVFEYIPENHSARNFFNKKEMREHDKKITRLKSNGVDEIIIKSLAILEDVADRYKHAELRNPSRNHEVHIRPSSFFELPWGEFKWSGETQVIIELSNQERRGLEKVIDSVVDWWQTIIPELR